MGLYVCIVKSKSNVNKKSNWYLNSTPRHIKKRKKESLIHGKRFTSNHRSIMAGPNVYNLPTCCCCWCYEWIQSSHHSYTFGMQSHENRSSFLFVWPKHIHNIINFDDDDVRMQHHMHYYDCFMHTMTDKTLLSSIV